MNASQREPIQAPLPRLLHVVELAQSLEGLEADLKAWVAPTRWPVQSIADLELIARAVETRAVIWSEDMSLDLRIAVDAWEAARRRPPSGFLGYIQIWQARLMTQRSLGVGDEGRLRALQQQLGGILIDGRAAPFLLLLPQPDGTWVKLGFETVTLVDRSPLGAERLHARIIKIHQLCEDDRRYVRTQ